MGDIPTSNPLANGGFSPWMPSMAGAGPTHYKIAQTGGETFTRFSGKFSWFPESLMLVPYKLNAAGKFVTVIATQFAQGNLPQFDMFVWQQAIGKKAFGPGVNAPVGTDPLTAFGTVQFPMYPKNTQIDQGGV
jgi:hypothetical protein